MQFSKASRTLHSYHDFHHIKTNHWKLMWWGIQKFFIEHFLYSSPHTSGEDPARARLSWYLCSVVGREVLPVFCLLLQIWHLSFSAPIWVPGGWPEWFPRGASKLWITGQVWLGIYFCMACELSNFYSFKWMEKKNLEKSNISWHVKFKFQCL